MIRLLLTPFNSHKINGDLEPKVVGEVLQNFKVRYKYFAVTWKNYCTCNTATQNVLQNCNAHNLLHSSKSLQIKSSGLPPPVSQSSNRRVSIT